MGNLLNLLNLSNLSNPPLPLSILRNNFEFRILNFEFHCLPLSSIKGVPYKNRPSAMREDNGLRRKKDSVRNESEGWFWAEIIPIVPDTDNAETGSA